MTQWRTTPAVVDWDRDGLPDLVMLDYRGYVCLFRRQRRNGSLVLLPPERIFVDQTGRFLNLSAGRAGASGRRKLNLVDWDGDGDLDLVSDGPNGPVWYENIGTQQKPVMQLRGNLLKTKMNGHNPTPYVVDWNGDGKLDVLVGTQDGFFYYFDRNSSIMLVRNLALRMVREKCDQEDDRNRHAYKVGSSEKLVG